MTDGQTILRRPRQRLVDLGAVFRLARHALETDGRSELLKVLDHDDPPRVIRCGSSGCSFLPDDAGRA